MLSLWSNKAREVVRENLKHVNGQFLAEDGGYHPTKIISSGQKRQLKNKSRLNDGTVSKQSCQEFIAEISKLDLTAETYRHPAFVFLQAV